MCQRGRAEGPPGAGGPQTGPWKQSVRVKGSISQYTEYVMCRAGLCSPQGHGSICTADSFSEHLAPHFLCQKDKSSFHLFEIHHSQRSPT